MVESFYKNGLKTKRYHYIVTYCSCCRHRATQNTNKVAGHRTFSRLETRLKCKLQKCLTTIGTALDDYGYGRIIGTETDIRQKRYCDMYHKCAVCNCPSRNVENFLLQLKVGHIPLPLLLWWSIGWYVFSAFHILRLSVRIPV